MQKRILKGLVGIVESRCLFVRGLGLQLRNDLLVNTLESVRGYRKGWWRVGRGRKPSWDGGKDDSKGEVKVELFKVEHTMFNVELSKL